jgi:hypothetical protein
MSQEIAQRGFYMDILGLTGKTDQQNDLLKYYSIFKWHPTKVVRWWEMDG